MLKSLHIANYALISELEIDFQSGFSVITGETGAGKSIILGALSLIQGQRADTRSIKEGEQKCLIEAGFDITGYDLQSFFEENELDYDQAHCIIRREITSAGKSRAFINDTPVSLNLLRDVSNRLIDIHSQHENLLLSNDVYQLQVVDTIAKNNAILVRYQGDFLNWKKQQSELDQLKKLAEKKSDDLDYIRFQFQQLADAQLKDGELEELEQEQQSLSHAEEIKQELNKTYYHLADDQMVLSLLKDSVAAVARVRNYIPSGAEWEERLQSAYIEIKDIADEIHLFEERVEFNPERLGQVENRLSELYGLLKKYKVETIAGLIRVRDEFDSQLQRIDSFDEEIVRLERSVAEARVVVEKSAGKLTASRQAACQPIEKYLVSQLTQLGMPNVQFKVSIQPLDEYAENGNDDIQFLFSANKNRSVQPVVQIASGGEIARVMLSVKSLIAHRAGLPTIIFDEIDTGISGEIAHKMGEIMKDMSRDMQVISITHLPQIAARGDQHYKVYKKESDHQTETYICRLAAADRVKEIAQMLSGKTVTEAALQQAQQLLQA